MKVPRPFALMDIHVRTNGGILASKKAGFVCGVLSAGERRDRVLASRKSLQVAEGRRMSFDLRAASRGLAGGGARKLDQFLPGQ